MSEPLSDEEIAELRKLTADGGCVCEYRCGLVPLRDAVPRVLDELERLRSVLDGVGRLARAAELSGDKDQAMAACFEIERRTERLKGSR